jgi:hypothetical protein
VSTDNHPLDWAVASFAEAMAQKPVEVTFERWKNPATGAPFVFHVYPVSVEEQEAITKAYGAGAIAGAIEVLIQRAKNAAGVKIFQGGHRARLRKETSGDDLLDLVTLISRALPPPALDIDAALKH